MPKTHGRHAPAFLLLFLNEEPSYGARLLARLQEQLPHCLLDSAIVYRTLVQLERQGLVRGEWKEKGAGQPRKWYSISDEGRKALEEYAGDIRRREENLQFFLERYGGSYRARSK